MSIYNRANGLFTWTKNSFARIKIIITFLLQKFSNCVLFLELILSHCKGKQILATNRQTVMNSFYKIIEFEIRLKYLPSWHR
jgi:hypothetical protein